MTLSLPLLMLGAWRRYSHSTALRFVQVRASTCRLPAQHAQIDAARHEIPAPYDADFPSIKLYKMDDKQRVRAALPWCRCSPLAAAHHIRRRHRC